MKKILFILPNFAAGGAEKVILQLLQYLDRSKYDLNLALLQHKGEFLEFIPNDIKVIDLKSSRMRFSFFKILKLIRTEKPDFVVSTLTDLNIMLCLLSFFINSKIIIRESNIVSSLLTSKLKRKLYRIFIGRANLIIAQSNDMKDDLVENFNVDKNKIILINNPVDIDLIEEKSNEDIDFSNKRFLIAVGRLSHQKGFDLLIETFSKIDKLDYYLLIIGQGNREKQLRLLAKELKVEDRILFLGYNSNPYKYIAKADFFISSSRFEGFPNAVIESLACGVPVIANNYKGGINEIINEDVGSIIDIKNVDEFQKSLSKHHLYNRQLIKNYCKAKYSKDIIIKRYENIL